jgi:hypothetical protein
VNLESPKTVFSLFRRPAHVEKDIFSIQIPLKRMLVGPPEPGITGLPWAQSTIAREAESAATNLAAKSTSL